jgi:polyphosphate kinase
MSLTPILTSALCGFALSLPSLALSHPHVFVDATIEVIFDETGRAEALRIGWAYDDLFSLTYVSEQGLDPDFDGVLTPAEQASLAGFDMDWQPGFAGDTYALLGDQPLGLSPPTDTTAEYVDGRLVSSHLRRIAPAVAPGAGDAGLVVQVYDPSFYTSYMIVQTPVLTGGSACRVQVFEPDRDAADAMLLAALEELSGSADTEAEFPAIGSAYAEEARITCAE